ncbi:MAG: hypothetical protein RLZZ511_1179 [Cyanobacteriota bacterium]|jgi:hypothetical protein
MQIRSRILLISGWLLVNLTVPAQTQTAQAQEAPAADSNSLVGQCRAANKRTPIYINRNPVSEVVMLLETNATVTIAENGGENGMIGVNKPKSGFVHAPNLKNCANAPRPTPPKPSPSGVCRLVVQPQGLVVRNEAGNNAPVVGSLAPKTKITLAEPISTVERDDGRIWLKVAQPVAGWVSNGFVSQQFRNLGACD